MPTVFNDHTLGDPGEYLTAEMPKVVANLVALRNELAARQGAMSAVDDALRKKAQAEETLAEAKAAAAALKADADAALVKAKEMGLTNANKARALDAAITAFEAKQADAGKVLADREAACAAREAQLLAEADRLALDEAALRQQQAELNQKVKALQDRVAALAL